MYHRILENIIPKRFFKGKAIIVVGARQVGKTTLARTILSRFSQDDIRSFNGDDPTDRDLLTNRDLPFLNRLIGDARIVFIDEGQKVRDISQITKLLVDAHGSAKQVLITGSSSIRLLDATQEPLTGRKEVYTMFPMSVEELLPTRDLARLRKDLDVRLRFGSYPAVASQRSFDEQRRLLHDIGSSALYRDLVELQLVRDPDMLRKLLRALALQLGAPVSTAEIAGILGIDRKTVERAIDLLERSFVIVRLPPYTRNRRREIARQKKVYFVDLGVRNAILNDFNLLENRSDVGALWENFCVIERMKFRAYHEIRAQQYFWRTYDGSEVDLVEECAGRLDGYECKWGSDRTRGRIPAQWLRSPGASYTVITPENVDTLLW